MGKEDRIAAAAVPPFASTGEREAELTALRRRFEDISGLVSDWVWETDASRRLTYASMRILELLHIHPCELLGRRFDEIGRFVGADGLPVELDWQAPFRDIAFEMEDRRGECHHFLVSGVPVFEEASGRLVGMRGTAQDVTTRKRTEAELIRAKEEADLANRAKTHFLTCMSHELRTPLNVIIGFSDLLRQQMFGPLGSPRYTEYVDSIHASGQHLLDLINDLLDISVIEAGRLELREEEIEPTALAETCLGLMRPKAERAGVRLVSDIVPAVPNLYADRRRVRQVLLNTLSNAIKYTAEGGEVRLRVACDGEGGLVMTVTDTGIGMSDDEVARALLPFARSGEAMLRNAEGTGLGLYLSRNLMELHGGTLTIESEQGVGTKVQARFPPERVLS